MPSNNTLFIYTITVYKAFSFTLFQLSSMRWLMVIFVFVSLFSIKTRKGTDLMFILIFNRIFNVCEQGQWSLPFNIKLKTKLNFEPKAYFIELIK